jgi:hypothetical protein
MPCGELRTPLQSVKPREVDRSICPNFLLTQKLGASIFPHPYILVREVITPEFTEKARFF